MGRNKRCIRIQIIILLALFTGRSAVYAQFSASEADSILIEICENPLNSNEETYRTCVKLSDYFSAEGDSCNLVRVLLKKSHCESSQAKFKEALTSIIESEKIYTNSLCDSQTLVLIHLAYAELYFSLHETDKADSIINLGIKTINSQWNDKTMQIRLLLLKGINTDSINLGLIYLNEALLLSRENNKPQLEQSILINIGTLYAINNNRQKALLYFKSAIDIAKSRNRLTELGILYNNLAGLSEEPREIISYIDSALHYAEKTNNLADLQLYSENKAYFYYTSGEYQKGYDQLWHSMLLKDSLLNVQKIEAIAEMEQKYEAEKKASEIKSLKLEKLNSEIEKIKYKRNQNIFLWTGIVFVLLAIALLNRLFLTRKSKKAIQKERDISDGLLRNILPEETARELKQKGYTDTKEFEQATILFTDFKGFTALSEKISATELVDELNVCFKSFDHIIEKYGIEKIKTIGDAYMAAGGIPVPDSATPADVINAGIEMQQFMTNRKLMQNELGLTSFEMRVGIHTGPVIAGVVGVKKFQYDIWGDTVNTASRLESCGEIGKVNISNSTYQLVKDIENFTFESRGDVDAKGKGKMRMWFVKIP